MKLRKQSLTLAVIGLLIGLVYGYYYADKYNRAGSGAGNAASQTATGQMPPDHPPVSPINQAEIEAAKRAAEKKANDFHAQTAAARLLYQANRLTEAADFYQRAHKLQPDDYDTIVQLGNTNFDIGLNEYQQQKFDHSTQHFLEAAHWYEQALAKNPDDVNVRTDYGLTYYYRQPQDLSQAIAQYRRSLQVQPTHPQTLANLTAALAEQGKFAAARESLTKLEQTSPDTGLLGQTLYNFTRALVAQQKWEQADLMLAKLEKLFPNVPEVTQLRQDIDSRRGTKIQPH